MGRRNKKVKKGGGQVATCDATSGDGAGADNADQSASEVAGFGLDGEFHPLLNSVVFANLLQYCPDQKVLSGWRLVCKTWWEESLLRWRSNATIKLICEDPSTDPYNSIYVSISRNRIGLDSDQEDDPSDLVSEDGDECEGEPRSGTSLKQFLTFLEGEGNVKPFRQFHLECWQFAPPAVRKLLGSGTGGAQLDRFWRCIGPSLTSLTLSDCNFASSNLFGKLIFKTCLNLRSLTLTQYNTFGDYQEEQIYDQEEYFRLLRQKSFELPAFGEHRNLRSLTVNMQAHPHFPMTWFELLSHVPRLDALKLVFNSNGSTLPHVKEVLVVIDMIRQHDGEKLPIKKFDIVYRPIECSTADNCLYYLDMFGRLQLPLRHLDISLEPELEESRLKEVLQSHSGHLKRIDGWRSPNFLAPHRPLWKFPFGVQLDNLEEMCIAEGFCPSFGLLRQTPNLRKLEIIRGFDGEMGQPPLPTEMVANTCELEFADLKMLRLKTLCLSYKVEDNELRRLINWFPELEELTMPLNDAQFAIVCEQWRDLRHLHVIGAELTNLGVTGNSGKQKTSKPNITLLKNLRCFEIEKMKSALSDRSAFHGFLKLPNLRRLGLTSDSNDFGLKARKALKSRIPRCYLKHCCVGFGFNARFSMFSCTRYLDD